MVVMDTRVVNIQNAIKLHIENSKLYVMCVSPQ